MNTTSYPIQSLLKSELTPGCLDTFARRQIVQNVWRRKDGQWTIVPEPFIDDWNLKERRQTAEHLRAAWAQAHGAQKLYISAHSAEESQAFYRSIGCIDALWISREHAEKEPYDCQMEYALLQD